MATNTTYQEQKPIRKSANPVTLFGDIPLINYGNLLTQINDQYTILPASVQPQKEPAPSGLAEIDAKRTQACITDLILERIFSTHPLVRKELLCKEFGESKQ